MKHLQDLQLDSPERSPLSRTAEVGFQARSRVMGLGSSCKDFGKYYSSSSAQTAKQKQNWCLGL